MAYWAHNAADAFKRTLGECRGVMYKDTLIYILSICVNMTLVCFLLMPCCSIYIKVVPGGAGHVWFIGRFILRHLTRAFILYITTVWRSLKSHLFIGWGRMWWTASYSVCWWQMWWFDTGWIFHTCSSKGSTFLSFFPDVASMCTILNHTQPHLEGLLFFCVPHLYTS